MALLLCLASRRQSFPYQRLCSVNVPSQKLQKLGTPACGCCPPPITGISGINREQARKNGKALKNKDFRDAKRESAGCKL